MRTTDLTFSGPYWQSMDGGRGYTDSTLWEDIAHIVKEMLCIRDGRDQSSDCHLIDVGCAMGYLVKHLRRRGVDAQGLDFSAYALSSSDREVRQFLYSFDLSQPAEPTFGPFNLLTCIETLEHIPAESTEQALTHLWDLLEPGGEAMLTICVTGQPNSDDDPTHVNVRERAYWDELFERQGWIPLEEKARYLGQFWFFSTHHGLWVMKKP